MKKKLQNLSLQTHVKIHTFTLILGAIVAAIGCKISEFGNVHPVVTIGFLIIVLSFVWRILFIKCPHCGSGMYGVRSIGRYCPDCGKKLF